MRRRLWIGHALVLAAMLLPFVVASWGGSQDILPKAAHVWSAPTMKAIGADPPNEERLAVSFPPVGASISLHVAGSGGAGLFLVGLLVVLIRVGLDRMQVYSPLISEEIERHGLPAELSVVPLVESGYRNVPADGESGHGAGLWMFIEATARRFGLTVDSSRDERLDVTAQTRAAMEYFTSLYRHFGDWGLAILAYNAGITKVEEGIRSTGSRDVWAIVRAGHENDPDYVSWVMAMVLVMENPSVLE